MSTHRLLRVREMLKREIGESIRRELPVDQAGLVTVNDVDVTGDLKNATVFISVFGTTEQKKHALDLLQKNRALIQAHVSKNVIMKYTPVLKFLTDDSVDRGNRVLAIIDQLEKNTAEEAPEAPPPAKP